MTSTNKSLSAFFKDISLEIKDTKVSLGEMLSRLGDRSHAFIILLASIPFLIPVTIPGFSTPFGLLIIFVAVCLAFQVPPKIPKRLAAFSFGGPRASEVFRRSSVILEKIEKLAKPRGEFAFSGKFSTFVIGLTIFYAGVLLALPTPPGGNFPPAVALVLLSVGYLEHDLLFVALGVLATIITTVLFYAIIIALLYGGKALLGAAS